MVFHWRLSDSKSPQVSRTLLSILAVFNNAVIWMVSIRPPTSKSSRPFNNPLVTVPKAPVTIGIIVTFMFHSFFFFQFSIKVEVFISLFTFYQFYFMVSRDSKVDNFANVLLFFFFDYHKVWSSGWDYVIRLYVKFITGVWMMQVSSSLQDSSQYSDRSWQCCSLGSLPPSPYFQLLQSLYQSFRDCTKSTNFYWYNRHFLVAFFFSIPSQGPGTYHSFCIISILLCGMLISFLVSFFTSALDGGILLESEWQQISRTLLRIQTDFNHSFVKIVSIRLPIPNPSSPLSISLAIVPSAPIPVSITVILKFHNFLSRLAMC